MNNFPSCVALSAKTKGVQLYMTCTKGGYLEFNPEAEVPSLISRFVLERGKETDHVHIRSSYKNKYLCRTDDSGSYILASGSNPVEDKKALNCTLFKVKNLGSQVVTFTHVQSGCQVTSFPGHMLPQFLEIGTQALRFTIVRHDGLAKLPKRVIFKGDNGLYLRCRLQKPFPMFQIVEESHEYNEFTSKDGSDRSAHYEITHYNGTIRVKSVRYDKFLRRNGKLTYGNWIWGDSDDKTINNNDTLFKVENLGNNVIALRNIGNDKICRRLSEDRLENCLRATETYVVTEARLVVEEPVTSRKLEARYNFDDAKVTSRKLIHQSTATGVNTSRYKDDELKEYFTYKKTRTTTWNTSTTKTTSVNAEINIKVPEYFDGKFQLSGQIVQVEILEKGSTFSKQETVEYKIKVPPMTKAILKMYVHEVTYDIPFSYIQTDKYTTGEDATIVDEVGVCQGFEAYDTHFEKEYIPL